MMLGLSPARRAARSRCSAAPRGRRRARAWSRPCMQTGGLLKDLTVGETVRADREPVRRHPPGRRGARAGRHRRHRRPPGRQVLRRPAAAAAVRAWPCCPTPSCSSSTSRPPAWTSRAAATSGPRSARTPAAGAPCCSPRTTSRRPTPTPTGSSWSATAGSSPTARPPRSRPGLGPAPSGPRCRAPTRSLRCGPSRASRPSRCAATRVLIALADTDAVARHLLTHTGARDLEITARGLEDAFIALTGDARRRADGSLDEPPPRPSPPPPRPARSRRCGGFNPPAAARAAPHAAQPAHGDLHPRHAGRLLPDVRHRTPYSTQAPATATSPPSS